MDSLKSSKDYSERLSIPMSIEVSHNAEEEGASKSLDSLEGSQYGVEMHWPANLTLIDNDWDVRRCVDTIPGSSVDMSGGRRWVEVVVRDQSGSTGLDEAAPTKNTEGMPLPMPIVVTKRTSTRKAKIAAKLAIEEAIDLAAGIEVPEEDPDKDVTCGRHGRPKRASFTEADVTPGQKAPSATLQHRGPKPKKGCEGDVTPEEPQLDSGRGRGRRGRGRGGRSAHRDSSEHGGRGIRGQGRGQGREIPPRNPSPTPMDASQFTPPTIRLQFSAQWSPLMPHVTRLFDSPMREVQDAGAPSPNDQRSGAVAPSRNTLYSTCTPDSMDSPSQHRGSNIDASPLRQYVLPARSRDEWYLSNPQACGLHCGPNNTGASPAAPLIPPPAMAPSLQAQLQSPTL
jgi:hypothetical protein